MKQNEKYDVVVAIDFGSFGSGFAFSFMNEDKKYFIVKFQGLMLIKKYQLK